VKINVTAPINFLGYGVVGLNIVKALEARGDQVALWQIGQTACSADDRNVLLLATERAKLFDVNAPSLRVYHQNDMASAVGRGLRVGFPIFELDTFTDVEKHQLSSLDLLFVPSNWAKRVCEENGLKVPVSVIPFAVDTTIFRVEENEDKKNTVFLNVGKWEVRKGHDVLVEAFNRAFEPTDDVRLRMLCHNPFIGIEGNRQWNSLYMRSKMGLAGKIEVVDRRLPTQQDVAHFMSQADCGVFPARAEGWNLDLAEMMAMGKQVIATDYSAHTEFCNEKNCRLIRTNHLEPAFDAVWFHGQGRWARLDRDDQVEQLVFHMRAVHNDKQNNYLGMNNAGLETFSTRFTWSKTAYCISKYLAG
jgi:glycosyltransferase involved in cell wall biosynthesis